MNSQNDLTADYERQKKEYILNFIKQRNLVKQVDNLIVSPKVFVINSVLRFCMDKARSKRMSQNSWDKYNKMIAQYIAGIIEITWDENGNLKTSEVEYDPKPGN
jgi:hypothetical protein